ncbi:unnamed protein product [Closterium sp. NIES-65]|nr:unnamed protein product [Closterium sp. NIES-65]
MRSPQRRRALDVSPAAPQALQAPGLNSAPSAGDINMTWYRWQSVAQPSEVDWRRTIVMTPVLNQQLCESCWALTSTDIVSIVWALVNNQTAEPLSPQHVCDCAAGQCCEGGWPEWGFQFILANGGLATNEEYPYVAHGNSTCRNIAQGLLKAKMTGWEKVPVRSNKALMKAVAQQPVLVYLASGTNDFISYSGGIFDGNCSGDIDHAMLLAGYNVTDPDGSYWILKNTWGTNWGENGFMRLRMLPDGNGKCNVMSENAIYPVFYERNSRACEVITPNPCGGGVCEVRSGRARCNCPPGFVERLEESAPKCVTATPCDANPNPCGVGTCNNEFDGTYTCSCPAGSVIGSRTDRAMTCIWYTVTQGDTCPKIANAVQLPVTTFLRLNPGLRCYAPAFQIGQPVCISGTSTNIQKIKLSPNIIPYTVQPNDTLASISADFSSRCSNVSYPRLHLRLKLARGLHRSGDC